MNLYRECILRLKLNEGVIKRFIAGSIWNLVQCSRSVYCVQCKVRGIGGASQSHQTNPSRDQDPYLGGSRLTRQAVYASPSDRPSCRWHTQELAVTWSRFDFADGVLDMAIRGGGCGQPSCGRIRPSTTTINSGNLCLRAIIAEDGWWSGEVAKVGGDDQGAGQVAPDDQVTKLSPDQVMASQASSNFHHWRYRHRHSQANNIDWGNRPALLPSKHHLKPR